MDDDIGETSESTPPAIKHTGEWAATSTYDIYMVDTPKDDGGGNSKRKRRGRRKTGHR